MARTATRSTSTKTPPRAKQGRRARVVAARTASAPRLLAAVDLGSNSFHMIVTQVSQGRLHVVDRLRERVQLAAGLNQKANLSKPAQQRALACLERFGERLRGLSPSNVRVVGTNTLRKAHNAAEFMALAQRALGHPVEIIDGREEARLIYLGVAHSLGDSVGQRLVVDIGGGSTELIIGRGFEPLYTESLSIGCVQGSTDFFPKGMLSRVNFERAQLAASQALLPYVARYRSLGWTEAVGASGTINAVQEVLRAQGWSDDGITLASLYKLRKRLIAARRMKGLKLAGLRNERVTVFPGGVAILLAIFESLGITRMVYTDSALREGVLYDMRGRGARGADVRERSVQWLATHADVDDAQAQRVLRSAVLLLRQVAQPWHLQAEDARLLRWAAQLHEAGLSVSHAQYHKHGAYLAEHTDMAGFSRRDQQWLATLILAQRGKLPLVALRALPGRLCLASLRLSLLLRLAVVLHRSRGTRRLPRLQLTAAGKSASLSLPKAWAARQPLTCADLKEEVGYFKSAGIRLRLDFI